MIKRVLVTVLTYPTPSNKYIETVCTAGITEDFQWIRIYPLKLRLIKGGKIHKFNWYDFDVEKRESSKDPRKESYHLNKDPDCISKGSIDTKPKDGWAKRMDICVDKVGCYTNYGKLLADSNTHKDGFISLATFKPTKILSFICEKKDIEELDKKKEDILRRSKEQMSLFSEEELPEYWEMAKSIPYKFKYEFEDDEGIKAKLSIEDWEVSMLYLNCIKNGKSESEALELVKQKYFIEFSKKDIYFFMGTRNKEHLKNYPHPYSIIGVFYPPKGQQPELF